MSGISSFLATLKETLGDISELNVRTFSGDLSTQITGTQSDLSDINALLKKGVTSGQLTLQASACVKLDGDVDQFISNNIPSALLSAHETAVDSAKESRKAIVDFVVARIA